MLKETIMDIIDLKKIEVDFDDLTEVIKINAMDFDAMAWAIESSGMRLIGTKHVQSFYIASVANSRYTM